MCDTPEEKKEEGRSGTAPTTPATEGGDPPAESPKEEKKEGE